GAAVIALATWPVNDRSFSHATSAPVRNLLGTGGAVAADLLMQLFGLAALALLTPVAVWGWRLFTHCRLDREGVRLALWIGGALAAAGFASCLAKTATWPLPTGLGGGIRDALVRLPAWVLGGPLHGVSRFVIAVILGVAALAMLLVASGFGLAAPEEDEESREGGSISIGWLFHGLLSLKARLARLLTLPFLGDHAHSGVALKRREEPRFERHDRDAFDEDDASDDEKDEDEDRVPVTRGHRMKAAKAAPARKSGSGFVLPALGLLAAPRASDRSAPSMDQIQENATSLESVLGDFGVRGEIINARPGPVVTLYELEPAP